MEGELRAGEFLLGADYSAADICLYGYVHCAEEGGFNLDKHPNVRRWRSLVQRQHAHVLIDDLEPFRRSVCSRSGSRRSVHRSKD